MTLNVSLDGADDLLKLLDKKTFNQVVNATIDDEGKRFTTQVAKDVTEKYNIGSREIKGAIKIEKPKGDNNYFNLIISSPRMSLRKFKSSDKIKTITQISRKGKSYKVRRQFVKVKIKRKGSAKLVQGGFIMNGRTLMKREHANSSRGDVEKLTTLSITSMFTKDIRDKGIKKIEEYYPKTLERHLNFYISKK